MSDDGESQFVVWLHCPLCGVLVRFELVGGIEWGYEEPLLPSVVMTLRSSPQFDPETEQTTGFHSRECSRRWAMR